MVQSIFRLTTRGKVKARTKIRSKSVFRDEIILKEPFMRGSTSSKVFPNTTALDVQISLASDDTCNRESRLERIERSPDVPQVSGGWKKPARGLLTCARSILDLECKNLINEFGTRMQGEDEVVSKHKACGTWQTTVRVLVRIHCGLVIHPSVLRGFVEVQG
jgi:hypothetical protein